MTIIVAYDDGDTICLGSDSCGIFAGNRMELSSKIIKKKNYYVGFEGSYRIADIIKETELPKEINKFQDLQIFRDILRQELIDKCGANESDEIEEPNTHPVSIIIISQLGIHELQSDYAILKPKDNFDALGAGREVALGCLETYWLYGNSAENAVKGTLKTVKKFCIHCGGKTYTAKIEREK